MESKSVDLIYLDPPFFSNRNYEVIWGDAGEVRSFQDRWAGGIEHYIAWLRERVIEMHRILKSTGSIFLHCDWHANANIRVDILDKIFLSQNFRNEIAWHYIMGASARKTFGEKYDTIFWYSKTNDYVFNLDDVRVPYNPETVARSKRGEARYKTILTEKDGKNPGNVWCDINPIQGNGLERIGYPTQKPEALLERIIKASSNKGDIVLDPFVGGGTTIAVADKLNRKWIGIDQSVMAVKVTDLRLKKQRGPLELYEPYELQLRTYNYDVLRNMDAFSFETMIIEKFGGIPNQKQRNDFGLDGRMPDNTPIQVKRSDDIGRNVIDNFLSAVKRMDKNLYDKNIKENKPIGYIIAFSFGKGAIEEVARLKNKEHIIIELKKVSDILPLGNPPKVTLTAKELEDYNKFALEATAETDAEIAFYSWDFNHNEKDGFKPDILLDKEGKQTHEFQSGEHQIAVEAVDTQGLDAQDKVKIKVK
ncbi:MAG: site-specific DNA-methyltransferase [Lentimicrobiaceae bacterium]|nr:site-specific DNA-methyltransferase [Lentimicrobiaceae bacterium]